jgi:hypothetical protein
VPDVILIRGGQSNHYVVAGSYQVASICAQHRHPANPRWLAEELNLVMNISTTIESLIIGVAMRTTSVKSLMTTTTLLRRDSPLPEMGRVRPRAESLGLTMMILAPT